MNASRGESVLTITPDQWRHIERVVDAALTLAPGDREAYLDRACGSDPWMRSAVRGWLSACADASSFLEESPASRSLIQQVEEMADRAAPVRVGPYRVLREIARGGMGIVYLAERDDGQFSQQVALKLIDRGTGSEEIHRRFLSERQILASLNHPNIARLLDGGVTAGGQPWFAMEYIDGSTITRHCDDRRLTIDARIALFLDVCAAVSHAHRNLVVHRDLKPSNILVTADGTVKLLDFGIAKLLSPEGAAATPLTAADDRVLTPEYASPEQVLGGPVTTTTDVYALGAVCYEILTGTRAHRLANRSMADVTRVVCEVEPPAPSAVVSDDQAHARGATRERLQRALRGDLDAIVLKGLRKDASRRYASVDALAEDLRRRQLGLPVSATGDSVRYRTGKYVRRHRLAVAATALVLLALLGGLAGTLWQAREAARESATARAVSGFVVGIFQESDPSESLGREVSARDLLARGRARLDTALRDQPAVRSELWGVLGVVHREMGLLPQADSLLRRSIDLAVRTQGATHHDVARGLADLARVFLQTGELDAADSVLQRALAIRRASLGATHPDVAETLTLFTTLEFERSNYGPAERYARDALAIDLANFGPSDLRVARDLGELASALTEAGAYLRADSAYQAAIAIQRAQLSPDHPSLVLNLSNLAALTHKRGEPALAERLARDVLVRRRRVLPRGHPDVANAIGGLVGPLRQLQRFAEAESLNAEGLAIVRATLRPDHPQVLTLVSMQGILQLEQGAFVRAESTFRGMHSLARASLGDDHPITLNALGNLAGALVYQGKPALAMPLQREATSRARAKFGGSHPQVGRSELNYAEALQSSGDLAGAEAALRRALAIFTNDSSLGSGSDLHANAATALALVLTDRGKAAEAEPLVRAALASYDARHGRMHQGTLRARRVLGFALMAMGRTDEAESILLDDLRALDESTGASWRTARTRRETLRRLIGLYESSGRGADARKYAGILAEVR
jgi:eukaryotic-like serine/threonine-protein kinase